MNPKIQKIERDLKTYNDLYRQGKETVSDLVFDQLYKYYKVMCGILNLTPKFQPMEESFKRKIQHSYPIGSIKKRTKEECIAWVGQDKARIELKIDGVGLSVERLKDDTLHALTRGDGVYGEDLSKSIGRYFGSNFVHFKGIARGEIFISRDEFKKYGTGYSSPRHYVAGMINSKNHNWKGVQILIYDLIDSSGSIKFDSRIIRLASLPFSQSKQGRDLNIRRLTWWNRIWPVDGIVVKKESIYRISSGYRQDALCWKFNDLTPVITRIMRLRWQVGRTGKITPLILLYPIKLNNKNITKVTGSNYRNIIDKSCGLGALVEIAESGMTIPQLKRVLKPSKRGLIITRCPYCYCMLHQQNDLTCLNEDCNGRLQSYLKFVFDRKNLNVKDLSVKRAGKMFKSWTVLFKYLSDEKFCRYLTNRCTTEKIAIKITSSLDGIKLDLKTWLQMLNLNNLNKAWAIKIADYCDNSIEDFLIFLREEGGDLKLPKNTKKSLFEGKTLKRNLNWFVRIWDRFQ